MEETAEPVADPVTPKAGSAAGAVRCAEDQAEAIEALFGRCEHRLGVFLAQMVRSRTLAEDLLQDTFHDALRSRAGLGTIENPEAWLFGIARNRALNALRKRRRFLAAHERLVQRREPTEANELELLALRDVLERHLTPEDRALLILRYLHGFDAAELGAVKPLAGGDPPTARPRKKPSHRSSRRGRNNLHCLEGEPTMSPVIELARDDELVRALLAPLERVQPVTLQRTPRRTRRSKRPLLIAVAITAVMLVGGLALAGAFGPLHDATLKPAPPNVPLPNNPTVACQLIGQPAGKTADILTHNGYKIEWRFQHWGSQIISPGNNTTPGAVGGGYTTAPATVPPDSIVGDITPDHHASNKLFVFVQAPGDANAPTIVPPTCPNRTGP